MPCQICKSKRIVWLSNLVEGTGWFCFNCDKVYIKDRFMKVAISELYDDEIVTCKRLYPDYLDNNLSVSSYVAQEDEREVVDIANLNADQPYR